jgi:hypothetical protein
MEVEMALTTLSSKSQIELVASFSLHKTL